MHHRLHGLMRPLKIGHEHFYFAAGNLLTDRLDCERKQFSAPVLAVVPVNAGDDRVLEAENCAGLGDPARLIVIDSQRSALLNRAETAAPGANVAENHECGRAAVPALTDIGTSRAFTNCVQIEILNQTLQFAIVMADRSGRPQPARPLNRLVGDRD